MNCGEDQWLITVTRHVKVTVFKVFRHVNRKGIAHHLHTSARQEKCCSATNLNSGKSLVHYCRKFEENIERSQHTESLVLKRSGKNLRHCTFNVNLNGKTYCLTWFLCFISGWGNNWDETKFYLKISESTLCYTCELVIHIQVWTMSKTRWFFCNKTTIKSSSCRIILNITALLADHQTAVWLL